MKKYLVLLSVSPLSPSLSQKPSIFFVSFTSFLPEFLPFTRKGREREQKFDRQTNATFSSWYLFLSILHPNERRKDQNLFFISLFFLFIFWCADTLSTKHSNQLIHWCVDSRESVSLSLIPLLTLFLRPECIWNVSRWPRVPCHSSEKEREREKDLIETVNN